MSLPIAIQSAVFYFVACTPCSKVRHRQKAKAEAKKERKEKAKLITEQPGLYRHPSPFNTNPYWEGEIALGPSLPKKSASKNSSQRGLNSSGKDSDVPSVSECTNVANSSVNFGDSSTFVPGSDGGLSDDWNRKRGYQREDEELWGQWSGHRIMDAFSKAKDSTARLFEGRGVAEKEVTEQARRDFYFSPKNPPINDYHPPVVSSKLPHRDAHRWMLQPPPPAKVMEGKVPVSRNVSSGSKSSGMTNPSEEGNIGRRVQEKLMRERMQRGEGTPTEEELIDSLFSRSGRSLSFNRSRSMSLDGVDESVELAFERRQKARAKPKAAPPGADSDDEDEVPSTPSRTSKHLNGHSGSARVAQRPKLETIASTGGGAESDSSAHARLSIPKQQSSSKLVAAA